MSASLVGSEMCIRDRCSTGFTHPTTADHGWERASGFGSCRGGCMLSPSRRGPLNTQELKPHSGRVRRAPQSSQ
eukprot:5983742-Alexandrium_andersonii.AAC.1